MRELESEAGEVPGSALTEPLTAAVTEALWRALGLEADRLVNDARQQFERDLKAEQAARTQADAATVRTQEHLQAAQTTLASLDKALASEQSAREQTTAELAQERLAYIRTDTQREAAQALAERDALRVEMDSVRRQTDAPQDLYREISEQRTAEQREWVTLQAMMTARLTDKDKLIVSLQRQIAEPPNDSDALVENDTGGV